MRAAERGRWQEPRGAHGRTTSAVSIALPAVRIKRVHHEQCPHNGGKRFTNWLDLLRLCSKTPQFVQLLKITFRLSHNLFPCFVNGNYSQAFQELTQCTKLCIVQ